MTGEPETFAGSEGPSPPAPTSRPDRPRPGSRAGEIITILSVVGIDQLTS